MRAPIGTPACAFIPVLPPQNYQPEQEAGWYLNIFVI